MDALKATRADCILLARGSIGNPKLIYNIDQTFKGNKISGELTYEEQKAFLLDFAKMLILEKGEKRAISLLKGIAPKFFVNLPNSKQIRIKLSQEMNSYDDLIKIIS